MTRTSAAVVAALTLLLVPATASAAPGDPDPSFGGGDGIVAEPVVPGDTGERFEDVVRTSDGSFVIAGVAPGGVTVARFRPDGTRDTAFGDGGDGLTMIPDLTGAEGLALAPDGKLVIAATFFDGAQSDIAVIRLLPGGDRDPAFGGGDGVVLQDAGGPGDFSRDVAVDAQGRPVVVGDTGSGPVEGFAARFTDTGALDASFGGGIVTPAIGTAGDDFFRTVALAPGGLVVVGGYAEFDPARDYDFFAARLRPDGQLDGTFGTGGVGSVPVGEGDVRDRVQDMALTPGGGVAFTGKIDVRTGMSIDNRIGVAVLTAGGQPDTAFGGDGSVLLELTPGSGGGGQDDEPRTLVAQPDGRLIVAADTGAPTEVATVLRFGTDGQLDPTWSGDGIATIPAVPGFERFGSSVLQPDGRFVGVGTASDAATAEDPFLVRLLGDEADLAFDAIARPAVQALGRRDLALSFAPVNRGPQAARGARVAVTPPAGTTLLELRGPGCDLAARACSLGDLAPGAASRVTMIVRPPGEGTYTGAARVSSATPDPVPGNDTMTDSDSIVLPPSPRPQLPREDTTAPRITGARMSPRTFRVAPGTVRIAQRRRRGAIVSFRSSEAGRLTLTVHRRVSGRRRGGRCVTGRRAGRRGRRCARLVRVRPTRTLAVRAGQNRIRFTGRLTRRVRLRPGRYRLTLVARDAAGNRSRPTRITFRIVR